MYGSGLWLLGFRVSGRLNNYKRVWGGGGTPQPLHMRSPKSKPYKTFSTQPWIPNPNPRCAEDSHRAWDFFVLWLRLFSQKGGLGFRGLRFRAARI